MTLVPDKAAVGATFSAAADQYDLWAEPQKIIARRLVDFLPDGADARDVLELGCGTGVLTVLLRRRYPRGCIRAIDLSDGMIALCRRTWPDGAVADFEVADAEEFTSDRPFDVVAASSTFQWLRDRRAVMQNVRGLLTDGGRLVLAVPVSGSLEELARAHLAVTGREMPQLDLWDEGRYVSALEERGFAVRGARVETFQARYAGALDVLRSLRGIGAAFRRYEDYRAMTVAQVRRLVHVYESRYAGEDGRVVATYRVLYAVSEAMA